jgi:phytoene dehydrogenase-like protein
MTAALNSYDAIVIGAGHNGLCLAAYLSRAGLKTAVLERRHEEGGAVNTEEPVLSGFRHNLHAQYMEFFDVMPFIHDFSLEKLGLRSIMPDVQAAITFADGRPPLIIYRPDLYKKTRESLAIYSKDDAELLEELRKRAKQLEPFLASSLYNPPQAGDLTNQIEMGEALFSDLGISRDFYYKSPKGVIDSLFKTPELRALLYRVTVEWGFPVETPCTGLAFLTFIMWTLGNWKLCKGGTHSLAKAMTQACYALGVDVIESKEVKEIIVKGKRAVGVKVKTGETYHANKLVASNADLKQTLLEMVPAEKLSPLWRHRAEQFRYGPSHVLATLAFCLYDYPRYKSASHNEDLNRSFYTVVGYESDLDMIRYIRDAYSGHLPKAGAGVWVNSIFDPSQAPKGLHALTGWVFMPPASTFAQIEWQEIRESYSLKLIEMFKNYTSNMSKDNILAYKLYTPDQMEVKNLMMEGDFSNGEFSPDQMGPNRPFPEASNYRTEIEGLYLCGASTYPGGGVHAACGYNCYKVIAQDFKLPAPLVADRGY